MGKLIVTVVAAVVIVVVVVRVAAITVVVTVVAILVAVGQMVDIINGVHVFTSGHDDEIGMTIKEICVN